MIRSAFKLLMILVAGILVYNYFLGTETEKENAREVFGKIKDVGVAVKDLLQAEKEKFDQGKYDKALDKIGGLFRDLKEKAKDLDENYLDRLSQLEQKRQELEERLQNLANAEHPDQYDEFTEKGDSEETRLRRELEELMNETDKLISDMEKKAN